MKLSKIHFAGFKSFVDSTELKLPANIIGVVGPNGCGKSNVIDAIRWVMGESSAKTLRGDNMADVIFNGSSARKPVGKASVELLFDNSDGTAPGAYGKYAEISVKRTLTRSGQSDYYLNSVKCRRKDITDLFLGTGLGPRSYSIIEQGMVSKIVEAKPEELRVFIEEAAGISKYKERRRETENRIRHTRENLERVNDIRRELDSQLGKLERQAEKAKRYKALNIEQQQTQLETWALQWQQLTEDLSQYDLELSKYESELEKHLAEQRSKEATMERIRSDQQHSQDKLNEIQGEFYRVSADITTLEQSMKFAKENKLKLDQQYVRFESDFQRINEQLVSDKEALEMAKMEYHEKAPLLEQYEESAEASRNALQEQELKLQSWQSQWDTFVEQASNPETEKNVQQARIQQLNARLDNTKEQLARREVELESITEQLTSINLDELREQSEAFTNESESQEEALLQMGMLIRDTKNEQIQLDEKLSSKRHQLHELSGKLSSLNELQKAAMGGDDDALVNWIGKHNLENEPRIASLLKVDSEWAKAVDTVLDDKLAAICLPNWDESLNEALKSLSQGDDVSDINISIVSSELKLESKTSKNEKISLAPLLSKVSSDINMSIWLSGAYIANSYVEAASQRHLLNVDEFIVLSNGVMMGLNWIKVTNKANAKSGLVSREKAIDDLTQRYAQLQQEIEQDDLALSNYREQVETLENQRTDLQAKLNDLKAQASNYQERLRNEQKRQDELAQRKDDLELVQKNAQQQFEHIEQEVLQAQEMVETAMKQSEDFEARRESLQAEKLMILEALQSVKDGSGQIQQKRYDIKLQCQDLQNKMATFERNIERNQEQFSELEERKSMLLMEMEESNVPDDNQQDKFNALLEQKQQSQQALAEAKNTLSGYENELIVHSQARQKAEIEAQRTREVLEKKRLSRQEWVIQQRNIQLQIEEKETTIDEVMETLNGYEEAITLSVWKDKLSSLNQKILQLGAVNLLAIEEYEEQSERKRYLDQQHDDLVAAMDTLESAINKIDKETKERFKITYEMLNDSFQKIFPQLFGGGSASLQLTDNDYLHAGVSVIARPPGKRNSTIHLLSGGEKALTAVSLLFSVFQLSPAPFCILDEVDAPLDDANVERYCRILKQMSSKTQLLFITHNKITMEIADLLIGVTMQEPGVSKVVAVDVEKAVEMTA